MTKPFEADTAVGPLLWRLSTLLLGVGLLVVGVGLLFSVLGLRAGLADFSSITLGLVTSAYFVGFVLGTFACPVVIRRVGHIRAFAAMASLAPSGTRSPPSMMLMPAPIKLIFWPKKRD